MYLDIAVAMANRMSFCVRKKVGSVIVKDGNIIAHGWNGMPKGMTNVCELDESTTNPLVSHAEKNALSKLRKSTETSLGADMYVTMCPCFNCAIEIVDAGISRVFFTEFYRTREGFEHLQAHGIEVTQIEII